MLTISIGYIILSSLKNLTILHICNDFPYTKVHRNLYIQLDAKGITQIVYHPLRNKKNIDVNTVNFETSDSKILYSDILKKHHRILFKSKVSFLYKNLVSQVKLNSIDVSYATTLFSDGAISYKLFRDYGIPYIVAVRNTDIHVFLKYRPDLKNLALEILSNARKVIFISQSNYYNFFNHRLIENKVKFKEKSVVVNNGIDEFWLKNRQVKNKVTPREILFIGKFDKNKNVLNLIKAFLQLRKTHGNVKLNLVGGSGVNEKRVREICQKEEAIHFFGMVTSKEELLDIFRKNDFFAMASHRETFGLVYVEALSQGLPVLFSKNQGIDNTFKDDIGVSVNPGSVSEIYNGLRYIIENYDSLNLIDINLKEFAWDKVASKYIKIFNTLKVESVTFSEPEKMLSNTKLKYLNGK